MSDTTTPEPEPTPVEEVPGPLTPVEEEPARPGEDEEQRESDRRTGRERTEQGGTPAS